MFCVYTVTLLPFDYDSNDTYTSHKFMVQSIVIPDTATGLTQIEYAVNCNAPTCITVMWLTYSLLLCLHAEHCVLIIFTRT